MRIAKWPRRSPRELRGAIAQIHLYFLRGKYGLQQLKDRTKRLALAIIELVDLLPNTTAGWVIGKQVMRSGTSIGANYRAACKARSKADFVSKITIVEEEADETQYWLELVRESGMLAPEVVDPLLNETKELTAIFTTSGRTAKAGLRR